MKVVVAVVLPLDSRTIDYPYDTLGFPLTSRVSILFRSPCHYRAIVKSRGEENRREGGGGGARYRATDRQTRPGDGHGELVRCGRTAKRAPPGDEFVRASHHAGRGNHL